MSATSWPNVVNAQDTRLIHQAVNQHPHSRIKVVAHLFHLRRRQLEIEDLAIGDDPCFRHRFRNDDVVLADQP